jgi:hypothetical protein
MVAVLGCTVSVYKGVGLFGSGFATGLIDCLMLDGLKDGLIDGTIDYRWPFLFACPIEGLV